MPNSNKTNQLARTTRRATAVTKDFRFTFEGLELRAIVSKHDNTVAIYNAFYKAIGTSVGLEGAITIINDKGTKLQLGYEHLKDNGKIHVRRLKSRTQGPLSGGAAAVQTKELLYKIAQNWKLDRVYDIFPDEELGPREKNIQGQPATIFDVAPTSHPHTWSGNFTGALYQLSKITKDSHQNALGTLAAEVAERHRAKDDMQQRVKGVTTRDIKMATEKLRLLKTADDALNVAYTENMVGGLQGALLESTLEGPTFSMIARGPMGGADVPKE